MKEKIADLIDYVNPITMLGLIGLALIMLGVIFTSIYQPIDIITECSCHQKEVYEQFWQNPQTNILAGMGLLISNFLTFIIASGGDYL